PPDDLADLLTPRPAPPSPVRESLLRLTERRPNRDRRLRRTAKVAAVFLVGGAAGWFARPSPVPMREVVYFPVIVPVPTNPAVHTPGSPEVAAPLSASKIEMQAELADDRKEVARLYRSAGDAFLGDQDYANAARCYRLYLMNAGDSASSLEPSDTW